MTGLHRETARRTLTNLVAKLVAKRMAKRMATLLVSINCVLLSAPAALAQSGDATFPVTGSDRTAMPQVKLLTVSPAMRYRAVLPPADPGAARSLEPAPLAPEVISSLIDSIRSAAAAAPSASEAQASEAPAAVAPGGETPVVAAPGGETPVVVAPGGENPAVSALMGDISAAAAAGRDSVSLTPKNPWVEHRASLALSRPALVDTEAGILFDADAPGSATVHLQVEKGAIYLLDFAVNSWGEGTYTVAAGDGSQTFDDPGGQLQHVLTAIEATGNGLVAVTIKRSGSGYYLHAVNIHRAD